jgi:hypothetical protein
MIQSTTSAASTGVELVEEVERGEAPVGVVEPHVLHQQRLERVLPR